MLISQVYLVSFIWTICLIAFALAKDYYKILGVDKTATEREIKKAFRKQALIYHPDRNKAKNAEAQFREIAEAYEILSNAGKRRQYDATGGTTTGGGDSFHHQGFDGGDFHFDFNEFYKNFDESFKNFQQGSHHHDHHFKFGFGSGDKFFNFDDLWDDIDLGHHHHGQGNGFDVFGGFPDIHSLFDGNDDATRHHFSHHAAHHAAHQKQFGGEPENCKTVTQKVGNTVTTYTQCG